MPNFDKTGPNGDGPKTGRGLGQKPGQKTRPGQIPGQGKKSGQGRNRS